MDRGGAQLVLQVDVGVVLEQHPGHLVPVPGARVEEPGSALVGAGVDLGAAAEQHAHDVVVARRGRDDQRGPPEMSSAHEAAAFHGHVRLLL